MTTAIVDGLAPLDDALTRLADRRISRVQPPFRLAVKVNLGWSAKHDLTVAFEVGCSATKVERPGCRYPNYFGACAVEWQLQ